MKGIAIAVGVSIFCAIAPISAEAKTDSSRSKCEQRCIDYLCTAGNPNPMECHWACHHKCSQTSLSNQPVKIETVSCLPSFVHRS